MKIVYVNKESWKQVIALRKKLNLKHNHQVITYLLENKDPQPPLLDIGTIERLREIQEKNQLSDINETIWSMISKLEQYLPLIRKYQLWEELPTQNTTKSEDNIGE